MKKKIIIYTDGACSGNPGPGGWGALLMYGPSVREISGYSPATTNNRMELSAAIEALKALKEPCKVDLYSDSSYLVNAINEGWLKRWTANNWKTAAKKKCRKYRSLAKNPEVAYIAHDQLPQGKGPQRQPLQQPLRHTGP